MASKNETVAEIGERMRKVDPTAFVVWWDQLAAAHNRELAAKDDERLTIMANYENVIAAKDREIAELRECLMEAVREKCPFTRMSCKHGEQCDYECGTKKWRKALDMTNEELAKALMCRVPNNYDDIREASARLEKLKVAEDALTELQTRLISSVYDGTMNPYEALEITERAIAAIREKGANNGK